ncbi:hypothetical protein AALP_AA7G247500 [Arabis alpina]|uniref:Uncharacterized protein n=1 Tax=Arabis alpina TaxID=50452 RepID=A0A087GKC6_ARAAL|nr:hypothetical protein AALP_AA7G247500 [Arabis alpina]
MENLEKQFSEVLSITKSSNSTISYNRINAAQLDFSEILANEVEAKLKETALISKGKEASDLEIMHIQELCNEVLWLVEYSAELYDDLKIGMNNVAPNLTALVGERDGFELLGSCLKVALKTASIYPPEVSSVVAHGFGIYVIGGRIGGRRSSSVLFLDCRSHTWTTLPAMGVARCNAAAGVVDGKIYVLGGCEEPNSVKWGEVFNPKTQTWEVLSMPPNPYGLREEPLMYDNVVMDKKIFAANASGRGLIYIPSEGELECREPEVMEMEWRKVMGLEALKEALCASKLVNYGGGMSNHWELVKRQAVAHGVPPLELDDVLPGHRLSSSGSNMLIFWDVLGPKGLDIRCAEISLERRKEKGEIWGNIVWSEAVMTLDPPPHQGGL